MPASYPGSVKSFTTKTDGVDYVMAAHVNEIQDEIAAVETDLLTGLVDYSGLSSVTGWGSFTSKLIWVKMIGKLAYVNFYIDGISNSVSTYFSLPVIALTGTRYGGTVAACNNGLTVDGGIWVVAGASALAEFYTNIFGGGWVASGQKIILGQFFIWT
jgi:hypothetical protein